MPDDKLVGSDEARKILGVHRATLLRWVADGVITPVHEFPGPRGAKLYRLADVEKLRDAKAAAASAAEFARSVVA